MKKWWLLTVSFGIFGLDRITKYWIEQAIYPGEYRRIIGNFVRFTLLRNPNGVFGIPLGGRIPSLVFVSFAFIFVLILMMQAKNPLFLVSLSFILGGAMGNLYDRVLYGEVIDFILVGAGKFYWPTFNVADSFVTIGIILAFIHWWKVGREGNSQQLTADG